MLAGSGKPLRGDRRHPGHARPQSATEDDDVPSIIRCRASRSSARSPPPRAACTPSVVRLPQVHDRDKAGLVPFLIAVGAAKRRVSAYVGDGPEPLVAAAHRFATPSLYRLALEKGAAGARYHAVEEEGIALKAIAEAIGRGLKVPAISMSPRRGRGALRRARRSSRR